MMWKKQRNLSNHKESIQSPAAYYHGIQTWNTSYKRPTTQCENDFVFYKAIMPQPSKLRRETWNMKYKLKRPTAQCENDFVFLQSNYATVLKINVFTRVAMCLLRAAMNVSEN